MSKIFEDLLKQAEAGEPESHEKKETKKEEKFEHIQKNKEKNKYREKVAEIIVRTGMPNDVIPGGLAAGIPSRAFDPEQIAEGIKVEMEHTGDPAKAEEIARDHLQEIPDYYERLDEMEEEAKEDKEEEEEEKEEEKEKDKEVEEAVDKLKEALKGD